MRSVWWLSSWAPHTEELITELYAVHAGLVITSVPPLPWWHRCHSCLGWRGQIWWYHYTLLLAAPLHWSLQLQDGEIWPQFYIVLVTWGFCKQDLSQRNYWRNWVRIFITSSIMSGPILAISKIVHITFCVWITLCHDYVLGSSTDNNCEDGRLETVDWTCRKGHAIIAVR